MSRTAPLEVCARCEMFKPAAEMTNVYARDVSGQIVTLRLCRSCAYPQLVYIQVRSANWIRLDMPRIISLCLLLSFTGLALFFSQALDVMPRVILTVAAITTAALGTVVLAWKSSLV